jgi:hypothetical protein
MDRTVRYTIAGLVVFTIIYLFIAVLRAPVAP